MLLSHVVLPAAPLRPNLLFAALLASFVFAASAVPAEAATTVSGDEETSPPLVIDPGAENGPISFTRSAATNEQVMFIQRMPVTKKIRSVTLGDLAGADSCTTPADYVVQIYEHATADPSSYPTLVRMSERAILPDTLGKVTWPLPSPALLKEGKAYSFKLGWAAGCQSIKLRSWQHDQTAVDSGAVTCGRPPTLADASGTNVISGRAKRLWHVSGANDLPGGCITSGYYDSSIATGWVLLDNPGTGNWSVKSHVHPDIPPMGYVHEYCGNGSLYTAVGGCPEPRRTFERRSSRLVRSGWERSRRMKSTRDRRNRREEGIGIGGRDRR